jgi:threonine/homoserine/homoserine lactone efflux protein
MVYVVTRALAQGPRAGLFSAAGVCVGILVHTALAALGVGAILLASAGLFTTVKLLGAGYLAYLGLRMMLVRGTPPRAGAPSARLGAWQLVRQGMLSNVFNPKIALFFAAFLPQFVDPASAHPARDVALLGVLYAALALPVKSAVGFAAGKFASRALGDGAVFAWMNRACGAALLALGIGLAATQRP